jgi:hypothetical protein
VPCAASTTAFTEAGNVAKNVSSPSTVASLSALRFSGRARVRIATAPRRSTFKDFGSFCRCAMLPAPRFGDCYAS